MKPFGIRLALRSIPAVVAVVFFQVATVAVAQDRFKPNEVLDFLGAIQMRHDGEAMAMLENNTNLVTATKNLPQLPLLEAAAAGNVKLVRRLLELGADVNAQGDTLNSGGSQSTALHVAIRGNHFEVCKILLEAGADPNRMAFGYQTPLHAAFNDNREAIAALLLDYGAEPFQAKLFINNETTPFELAISKSDGKLVPRMLGQDSQHPLGIKSLQKPKASKQPRRGLKTSGEVLGRHGVELLTTAAQRGELEAVLALLHAGISIKDANTNCPTILQAYSLAAHDTARNLPSISNQLHQVQAQLKADYIPKAEPGFVSSLRAQEAGLAARVEMMAPERWQRVLEALVEHGADYDAFAATALGDTNQAKRLLSADPDVSQARDCKGQTPLDWAIQTDHPPMVAFWLAGGVPLDATNYAGQTALHLAANAGKAEFVRALLAARASTNIRDTNGWTPLDAAIQAKQADCIHLLLPAQASAPHPERGLSTILHQTAATGNVAALAAVLETETNLEARNELGLTPLQVAVQSGHLAAAALLVDKGANVNARDPDGNTLLLQTIPCYFNFFVRDRPPTNWVDRMGNDPRKETYRKYLAAGQYEQGPHAIMQTVSFLLACGIDVKATNNARQTAVQLAADEHVALFDDREPLLKLLQGAGGSLKVADAEGNTPLHRLAHAPFDAQAEDAIKSLLASGADVNAKNTRGRTPLHETVQPDYIWEGQMKMLLDAQADANAQDTNGYTPLHLLALSKADYGRSEAAHMLLAAGAKPDVPDNQGETPLLLTVTSSTATFEISGLIKALLDAGADPNTKDKHGRAPAHLLLLKEWPWHGAGDGIAALAKAGGNLSAKDNQGKTPLHYLASLGNKKPLFFMRGVDQVFKDAKVDFQSPDRDGDTPAIIAAKSGTQDVFDWLVKQGADLDATNNRGETARLVMAHKMDSLARFGPGNAETDIHQAAREGNVDAASRLLKADPLLVNQTNQYQQTPLRVAVMQHQTNMVAFLESHGAKWDAGSAVMAGRADVLEKILQQDSSAVRMRVSGKNLLHVAVANGDLNMVQLLVSAHCDVNAKDDWGVSPLGCALLKNAEGIKELLMQRGAKENLFDAVYADDLKAASRLLEQDKSLASSSTDKHVSVVEVATATGRTNILKLLLKNGADLNGVRQNPVRLAAFFNQPESLGLLIRAGVKLDTVDSYGFAPLHWAAIVGGTEVADLLLKHKADVNQEVTEVDPRQGQIMGPERGAMRGDTPLHLAALCGQTNMVELLLKAGADVNAVNAMQLTPLDLASSMRPPSIFSIGRLQRGMLGIVEPLFTDNQKPRDQNQSEMSGRRFAASLIKAAGGKNSGTRPPF